ncbi:hypothetical protein Ddye_011610 [Dipteronia dyeriana]|uniref:Uncharacterized protein n=1 Tax=Dipteronia dyeriana TaxID=168575 RepID=A0AAD9X2T4_9ROSI|nr:hypothetical protein Ddye_011610 [Dipteronia dyeriana]
MGMEGVEVYSEDLVVGLNQGMGDQIEDVRDQSNTNTKNFRNWKHNSADLMFLSETKLHSSKASRFKDMLGFRGGISVDSNGKSGGLFLLWFEEVDATGLSFSAGDIDARIKMHDGFL